VGGALGLPFSQMGSGRNRGLRGKGVRVGEVVRLVEERDVRWEEIALALY